MTIVDALALVGRIGFAALYLIGAVFNLTYGRSQPEVFYGSFAETAWFGLYRRLIRVVIVPNGARFAILLAGFELALSGLIASGGTAMSVGLGAGIAFSLSIVPASGRAGAIAGLGLALVQGVLLWIQVSG